MNTAIQIALAAMTVSLPIVFVAPDTEPIAEATRDVYLDGERPFWRKFGWELQESDYQEVPWPSAALVLTGETKVAGTCEVSLRNTEGVETVAVSTDVDAGNESEDLAKKLAEVIETSSASVSAASHVICGSSAMVVITSLQGRWEVAGSKCSIGGLVAEPLASDFVDNKLDAFEALAFALSTPRTKSIRTFVVPANTTIYVAGSDYALATHADLAVIHDSLADAIFLPVSKFKYPGAKSYYLYAHEIGHLLLNESGHANSSGYDNLMRLGLPNCDKAKGDCPQLTDTQVASMRSESFGRLLHPTNAPPSGDPAPVAFRPLGASEMSHTLLKLDSQVCLGFFGKSFDINSGLGLKVRKVLDEATKVWQGLAVDQDEDWNSFVQQVQPKSYRDYLLSPQ